MFLDAVREDLTLYAASSSLKEISIAETSSLDREQFWGSLRLELHTGVDVPIPSVSPDMRILSYEVTPPLTLSFSKDDSDNFYVRSEETGVFGIHNIIILVDAKPNYFAAKVPKKYRVGDLRTRKSPIPLPANVLKATRRAKRLFTISNATPLHKALDQLVHYFRSFSPKPIRALSGNIYEDLFHSQAGVCRHRSFAFMITANALGIPTRYISNEAHAWVEVWIPDRSWTRIDLGGAALRLEITSRQK